MNRRTGLLAAQVLFAAIILILLAPRSSYQPGALLAAHQQLSSDCAGCHRPWRGPSSTGCVNCHGDIDNNPHDGFDVSEQDTGLLPGHKLKVNASGNLECLSCHSEHLGAAVNVITAAAFACTWCHEHPAIEPVSKHQVSPMARQYSIRHLFKQPFNHELHKLLITSHYPPRDGFTCTSCHIVHAVAPYRTERMSLKWSGCAGSGCHLVPQDSFMQAPASLGPSPVTIPLSGMFPVRHINASFVHSAGHLESACEQCHSHVAASKNPDDGASLAIEPCFNCHAHQSATASAATSPISGAAAFAAPRPAPRRVIACGACHLFHTYGVVPIKDFSGRAPDFPPNQPRRFELTIFVPHWEHKGGTIRLGHQPRPLVFSLWWLGLLAIAYAAFGFSTGLRRLPRKQTRQEAVAGVAPQRAKEVPALDDTYQTSIRHLYIIGEAAGTASINLAMRSGRQVIEAVANEIKHAPPANRPDLYDVLIVGCGPAGLGATATAKVSGLKYITLEKLTPASTLRSYPRAKFVQATPIDIEEYGSFFLEGDNSREELIKEWEKIIAHLGLVINEREEVIGIVREQDYLAVRTVRGNIYRARCVVLAIGVRGNPRHLNLPGEVPGRVFYNLIEPGEFTGRKILVVGGGNAGAEAAQALAALPLSNAVSYSFRSPVLTNVTRENAEHISELQRASRIRLYPATALAQIRPRHVILEPVSSAGQKADSANPARPVEIENDVIFAMIGAELPTAFLKEIGVKMVSKGRPYG
jgi:thioredoxin reductase (NADPH)